MDAKNRKIIEKVEEEAKKYFIGADGCHDWSHVERVGKLAFHIAKKMKANLFVIELASLLHDAGRKKETEKKGAICHAEEGAEIAKRILAKYKIPKNHVENVVHCIISHRYRNNHIPISKEAKILYDADKLNSIGAVGIGRNFLFAGNIGATLHSSRPIEESKEYTEDDTAYREYIVKLKKVASKMLTKEGKKIAQGRHEFMVKFFNRFLKEVEGEI